MIIVKPVNNKTFENQPFESIKVGKTLIFRSCLSYQRKQQLGSKGEIFITVKLNCEYKHSVFFPPLMSLKLDETVETKACFVLILDYRLSFVLIFVLN